MKTLLNRWFIVACLIWLMVTIMRRSGHPLPVLNYYVLSPWHVVFIVSYVSVLFELALPSYSKTYTGDWIDVALYVVGGTFFYKIINKPIAPDTREITV